MCQLNLLSDEHFALKLIAGEKNINYYNYYYYLNHLYYDYNSINDFRVKFFLNDFLGNSCTKGVTYMHKAGAKRGGHMLS